MSSAATPSSTSLRVVSYNLLSSKLAQPSHYTHAEPEHLEPEYRLPMILSKLDDEMKRGFGPPK
jgi:mRNA deadenylase 3'-5' endonuclease subunit Ccr4